MDGIAAVVAVASAYGPLTALVPARQILAGRVDKATKLPAIEVVSVATTQLPVIEEGATRRCDELVQATVHAGSFPEVKAAMRQLRNALSNVRPTVAGITLVSIDLAPRGPDGYDPETGLCSQVQEARVQYNEPTS